mgnify:CR=1 FL=1
MHLPGQCVGDADQWAYDPRLDNFAPSSLAGKPEEIRAWGTEQMKYAARAAKNMGVKVVTFSWVRPSGNVVFFPQTSEEQIEAGYQRIKELWSPIMDVYDACGVSWPLRYIPQRSPTITGVQRSSWKPLHTGRRWASTLTPAISSGRA